MMGVMRTLPMDSNLLAASLLVSAVTLATACTDDAGTDENGDEIGATETTAGDSTTAGEAGETETESGSGTAESSTDADTTADETTTADTTADESTTADDTTTDDTTETTTEEEESTDTTETGDPCGPECCPGETQCVDDVAQECNEDGTAWEDAELCDDIQGVVCDTDLGECVGDCSESAIGLSYIGCDYYPTVTLQYDSYNTSPKDDFAVAVANTGDEDAMVTVTQGDAIVYDTVVSPADVAVITLPWVNELTKGNAPTKLTVDGAYRLRSDKPIVVYQYNPLDSTTTNDASLMLPTNAWGNDYMVASWAHWNSIPGFYTVVAHEDDTTVTVSGPPNAVGVSAGANIDGSGNGQVTLDNSDVLQVVTTSGDLTGSYVSADKPVQVIGGHKCTNVPANISACDHLEESLFPIQTLSDEYIVVPPVQVPNNDLDKAQMVRVIATEDDTQVTFDPDQSADATLDTGEFIQLSLTTAAFQVNASKPVLVVQYMVGQSGGYGTSDPAMVQAVTPAQFRTSYLFHAAPTWTANFVDIIAPDGANVTVDGVAVTDWSAVGTSGFNVGHVALSNAGNGNHTVESNLKVGISVYGVQSAGSYWYPGGLDLVINPQ
ncbi:bacterial Ig-like domain protein [Plesiocystis pacifica SIR-1]|uniref:Bacterial Ig-like domain protein n=2 Tax=Plesiocystis pacifica TaxID=191768 RepID=A6FXJ1_9BACT|nr:bacterial Ig-like domain protein [Plesiocystis pacifica SIR-1]